MYFKNYVVQLQNRKNVTMLFCFQGKTELMFFQLRSTTDCYDYSVIDIVIIIISTA